jgi:hypothetical protein
LGEEGEVGEEEEEEGGEVVVGSGIRRAVLTVLTVLDPP